jgi:predicted homoserine dehydrogenase-like protein
MTSLSTKLAEREASSKPIQIRLIGARVWQHVLCCQNLKGMYRRRQCTDNDTYSSSQVHRSPGMRLAGTADLSKERALASLERTGFPKERYDSQASFPIAEGIQTNETAVTTDSTSLIVTPGIDVILEVTGSPAAGVRHALLCCENKKHIVMINVEAGALAGPLLARKAQEAGIIYSMAYGEDGRV